MEAVDEGEPAGAREQEAVGVGPRAGGQEVLCGQRLDGCPVHVVRNLRAQLEGHGIGGDLGLNRVEELGHLLHVLDGAGDFFNVRHRWVLEEQLVLVPYRVVPERSVVFEAGMPERECLYAGGNAQLAL